MTATGTMTPEEAVAIRRKPPVNNGLNRDLVHLKQELKIKLYETAILFNTLCHQNIILFAQLGFFFP
jgi:hypothetical protein